MIELVVAAAILSFVVAMLYNGLVRRRNAVDNAFGGVDAYLMMRYDLVPRLVETVKGYAAHEQATLAAVIEARRQATESRLSVDQRVRLDNRISGQMAALIATAEAYPELRASEHFRQLQRALNEVEERISASRRAYNAAVLDYNDAVDTFPGKLVAGWFGFARRSFFAAGSAERARPAVPLAR